MSTIPKIVCETLAALGLQEEIPSWKIMDNKGKITVVLHWEKEHPPGQPPSLQVSPCPWHTRVKCKQRKGSPSWMLTEQCFYVPLTLNYLSGGPRCRGRRELLCEPGDLAPVLHLLHHRPGRAEAVGRPHARRQPEVSLLCQLHALPQPRQLPQLGQRQHTRPHLWLHWPEQHARADKLRRWVWCSQLPGQRWQAGRDRGQGQSDQWRVQEDGWPAHTPSDCDKCW